MSVLLIVLTFVGTILTFVTTVAVMVTRGLLADEIKGRIQRHITASLDATIAALPDELQTEWAEEWHAELASVIGMPLTALQFVRGARHSARELLAQPALAPVSIDNPAPAPSTRRTGSTWSTRRLGLQRLRTGLRENIERIVGALVAATVFALVIAAIAIGGAVGAAFAVLLILTIVIAAGLRAGR